MKKLHLTKLLMLMLITVFSLSMSVCAASKPASTKKVTVVEDAYGKYWNAHAKELKKKGYIRADGYTATVSWKPVSGVKGYTVTVYWKFYDNNSTEKTVVNVEKVKGGYKFSTKGTKHTGYSTYYNHFLAKSAKSFIVNKKTVKSFTGKDLSFFISGDGSSIHINKVEVKSYKVSKGKKVYSKATTKKL